MDAPTDGRTETSATESSTATDFESAQRDLFEAVGLDARSRFVDLPTPLGRTHVFEAGPVEETGEPPLVFAHGTAAFGAFLAPLMAHLDDARLVAFDRPGYGRSDPFTYTEANVQRTVVDTLVGVLDALDVERVDLVGHSMGGHAGILFALRHPERVRNLFLVGSVPAFPGTTPPLPLRLMTAPLLGSLLQRFQKSGEEGVLDIAAVFGERDTIPAHPALIRAIAAHEADPKAAAAGRSEFAALFSVRGWHPSIRLREADLRRIQHPTTVVWGDHDTLGGPDDVRASVDAMPNARLETVDAGHIPFLAHLDRCAQLVREGRDERTDAPA